METTQNQHNLKFDESIYDDFQDGKGHGAKKLSQQCPKWNIFGKLGLKLYRMLLSDIVRHFDYVRHFGTQFVRKTGKCQTSLYLASRARGALSDHSIRNVDFKH